MQTLKQSLQMVGKNPFGALIIFGCDLFFLLAYGALFYLGAIIPFLNVILIPVFLLLALPFFLTYDKNIYTMIFIDEMEFNLSALVKGITEDLSKNLFKLVGLSLLLLGLAFVALWAIFAMITAGVLSSFAHSFMYRGFDFFNNLYYFDPYFFSPLKLIGIIILLFLILFMIGILGIWVHYFVFAILLKKDKPFKTANSNIGNIFLMLLVSVGCLIIPLVGELISFFIVLLMPIKCLLDLQGNDNEDDLSDDIIEDSN